MVGVGGLDGGGGQREVALGDRRGEGGRVGGARRAPARARRRIIEKQRVQFLRSAPIGPPAQFIVDEPADDGFVIAARRAQLARAAADVRLEVRVEHIGKCLLALPAERHGKIDVRRHRERRRPGGCDRLVRPGAERVDAPARQPRVDGFAPGIEAAVFAPARVRVRDALGVLDFVLVEVDGVDALRQEAAAVGVDQPERAVALGRRENIRPAGTGRRQCRPIGFLALELA